MSGGDQAPGEGGRRARAQGGAIRLVDLRRHVAVVQALVLAVALAVLLGVAIHGTRDAARRAQAVPAAAAAAGAGDGGRAAAQTGDAAGPAIRLEVAVAIAAWLLAAGAGAFLAARVLRPLRQADARQESFLANAAHELRTPLAVIRTGAEQTLLHDRTPAEYREALGAVVAAAERAGSIVTDMLVLARLDAGSEPTRPERLRLDLLVEAVADAQRPRAGRDDVLLVCEPGDPVVVEGDERLLERVVANLVENAVRHGGHGATVRLATGRVGSGALVVVEDDGPGVPPGEAERVFERFYRRAGAPGPGAGGGAGLGLPICRAIVTLHGGDVRLVQVPGRGCRFEVMLPLDRRPVRPPAPSAAAS